MKKKFFIKLIGIIGLLVVLVCIGSITTYAVSPTPAANDPLGDQINVLKEKIASRVAQLKLVERRGVIGTVTESTSTQLTLTDSALNTRYIDVDELTKFSSPTSKESFGISDIRKGTSIGILGLYNKESRRILARFVDVIVPPFFVKGAIGSIDNKNFSLTVTEEEGTPIIVDIEKTTKTFLYNKNDGLIKSGFSRMNRGERIIAIGFSNTTNPKRIIASKIIHFQDLPKNPKIPLSVSPTSSPLPTQQKTTESGKKKIQ